MTYSIEYYEDHKEAYAESTKKWREANPEKVSGYRREYYEANKEYLLAQMKEYRAANPETVRASQRSWKEANEGHTYTEPNGYVKYIGYEHPATAPSGLTGYHRIVLWDKLNGQDALCTWCERQLFWSKTYPAHADALVADHLNAVKNDNRPENLVPSCGSCNSKRADHTRQKTQIGECEAPGCDRDKVSRDLCGTHFNQQWAGRELSPIRVCVRLTDNQEQEIVDAVRSGGRIVQIAQTIGCDSSAVARAFARLTGQSIREFKNSQRTAA